jgi:hypothetical protein
MLESLAGFSVAATRQNAGRLSSGAGVSPVMVPSGSAIAIVILPSAKGKPARLSQLEAMALEQEPTPKRAKNTSNFIGASHPLNGIESSNSLCLIRP